MSFHRGWLIPPVVAALAVTIAIVLTGCHKAAPIAPPAIPEVAVTTVIRRDVPLYSSWVGTTEGFVNAHIHPQISGYILKQAYQEGDHVRQGQLLFQIDDREYKAALDQALGDLAQKQADLKKNQQDLARYKPLLADQVISRQDFDHVNQSTHASAAAVQAAQAAVESARLNLGWTRVQSPIDGVAGIAKAQVGDLVSLTTLLTTVSQLDPIKVTFPISEREYLQYAQKIKEHQEKGVAKDEPTLEMILADGSVYPHAGHFYIANREVNVQIVLEPRLFQEGQKPAINVGKSVSRVGGKTQAPAMRKLAENLRLEYAQFLELEIFTRFGGMIDEHTRGVIEHGRRIRAVLTQPQYSGLSMVHQVALLLALNEGMLDSLPVEKVGMLRAMLARWLDEKDGALVERVESSGELDDATRESLRGLMRELVGKVIAAAGAPRFPAG